MLRPEIAVLRFGLGARPGELAAAAADPRGWLRAQTEGPAPSASTLTLASSADIFSGIVSARAARRQGAALSGVTGAGTGVVPGTAAALGNAAVPGNAAAAGNAVPGAGVVPSTGALPVTAAVWGPGGLPAVAAPPAAAPVPTAAHVLRDAYQPHYRAQVLARAQSAAMTTRPFTERLVHFWSNHFAVSADKGAIFGLAGTLENEAIRTRVNGRFIDLLQAVERHPAMIAFLDNQYSVGANSRVARRAARRAAAREDGVPDEAAAPRRFGINENLAREILELHTLGVNGGYTQQDVTSFAQILTGWSIGGGRGRLSGGEPGKFCFREELHEPGPQTFLGKTYREEGVDQGDAVLAGLSAHASTAHFIAVKLVRHFVADDPPAAAVDRVARAFQRSGGDLPQVYAALIDSPEAWDERARKFKTPQDFLFSAQRALSVVPERADEMVRAFELLGQRQYTPGSPAGWPDTALSWDGSDALMHRVSWSTHVAGQADRGADPVDVATAALGGFLRPQTLTALRRAATAPQALALLLMSPEFQRR